jgi:hypothetical protein
MVAFSLLLLSCIETGWAEKNPVLDDDGNVITEAEIKANMGDGYRFRFSIEGGVLSAGVGFLVGVLLAEKFDGGAMEYQILKVPSFVFSLAATTSVGITASYYTGKHFDRQRAIRRIEEQRRKQKEQSFLYQGGDGQFYMRLLSVKF